MNDFGPGINLGVFGHGHETKIPGSTLQWVELFGQRVASQGGTLFNGGGGGIMAAARRGALKAGGRVVSVCPELEVALGNPAKQCLGTVVATGQGKLGRVHVLTQSVDIGFAFGGGAGTFMEVIACYLLAKPVIVLDGFFFGEDPRVQRLLNRVTEETINGVRVKAGYLDAKHGGNVCPVRICPGEISPDDVLTLGMQLLTDIRQEEPGTGV